ncbi:MAG: acyloxyacyl hydrolase [Paludibacterium sp.]|uniref:acyloxyacyl hydrolase n=1 Tax=Paludibacterium sp. TaxID=1917523 RepID=UPI0025DF783C|nr:acyloxyacyl hydrolase [Paludibacterium sp.]MBV8049353.1 acyloxyacyl hydrolase [Paludibacterium sp.]MBV8649472.1 acyloxyacyl hydrolase [Paludibacterium sp.]
MGQWQLSRYKNQEQHKNLTDVGITPVFRWQHNDKKGLYIEAGVGAHLFSAVYDNDGKRESTAFQFGDHIGVGYVFQNRADFELTLQHFSNAGIKEPNDGVNLAGVTFRYAF